MTKIVKCFPFLKKNQNRFFKHKIIVPFSLAEAKKNLHQQKFIYKASICYLLKLLVLPFLYHIERNFAFIINQVNKHGVSTR